MDDVKVLAVDDDEMNLAMIDVMLAELRCTLIRAGNGQQALAALTAHPDTDVVLLDLEMPVMDGYDTLSKMKESSLWWDIPVIVVTSGKSQVTRTLALGANDFLGKPYNPQELRLRVQNHVRGKKHADLVKNMAQVLEAEVVKKTSALQQALHLSQEAEYEIAIRLGKAAEFRDQDTGLHISRISELSRHLGRLAGLDEERCEMLFKSAALHDVGKIGIPDKILLKPGRLDESEFEIMKQHTVIGGKILDDAGRYQLLKAGAVIALQHHERWDGSGYPQGRRGEEIDVYARIVSIVDVFDALTSQRPYKPAFSVEESLETMKSGSGQFFDPTLWELFLGHVEEFVAIKERLADTPESEIHLQGLLNLVC